MTEHDHEGPCAPGSGPVRCSRTGRGTGHQQLSAAIAAMTEDQVRTAFSYLFLNLLDRRGPWESVISNAVNAGIRTSPVLRSDREGIRERLQRQAGRGGNEAAAALLGEFECEWARQDA
jgi:hypothetical protein